MDSKVINIKKSMLKEKEITYDFVCTYQYITSYVDNLFNNLNLYNKVMTNNITIDDIKKWYNIFYGNNVQNSNLILQNIKYINLKSDYNIYRTFTISEVNRFKPFIEMHLTDARTAVSSLNMTKKRIDNLNQDNKL